MSHIPFQAVTLQIGCKINLTLRITGVRPDGWHELDSLFIPLPQPCDQLTIRPAQTPGIHIICETQGIDPRRNTLTKAYAAFAGATGFAPAIQIHLTKGIPHGAGLGGGSADAAILLRWLNHMAPAPLQAHALTSMAAGIGADVPFFLQDAPCWATGIGDQLTPCCLDLPAGWLVLVVPPAHIPTPWAYRAFDQAPRKDPCHVLLTDPAPVAINGSATGADTRRWHVRTLINDFEPVVFAAYPVVRSCKEQLYALGAQAAVMSGSGAGVVGLFRHQTTAEEAGSSFRRLQGYQVFVQRLPAEASTKTVLM